MKRDGWERRHPCRRAVMAFVEKELAGKDAGVPSLFTPWHPPVPAVLSSLGRGAEGNLCGT